MCQCVNVSMCQCVNVSMCQCVNVSMFFDVSMQASYTDDDQGHPKFQDSVGNWRKTRRQERQEGGLWNPTEEEGKAAAAVWYCGTCVVLVWYCCL
jgi:hypothetical protein